MNYNKDILSALKSIVFQPQGIVGDIPNTWARDMGISHDYELPKEGFSREDVRKLCQDKGISIPKAYLIVMAWGAQGRGPGGRQRVQASWGRIEEICNKIDRLRNEEMTRAEAYDMFIGDGAIENLGPAYFTKLLYFFNPKPNMYIMDQWTTKPIILLTEKNIIRHTNQGPTGNNTGRNYELFCRVIDDLVKQIDAKDGQEVEQRLFSVGSIRRQPRGEFRQIVFDMWQNRESLPRYNDQVVDHLLVPLNH